MAVVLDFRFSKFLRYEKFRTLTKEHDLEITVHYLNIAKAIRKEHVIKRNTEKGTTFEFEVSDVDFEFMETWFEALTLQKTRIQYYYYRLNERRSTYYKRY